MNSLPQHLAVSCLSDLDEQLAILAASSWPNPKTILAAVTAARETLAALVQSVDELEARCALIEEEVHGNP